MLTPPPRTFDMPAAVRCCHAVPGHASLAGHRVLVVEDDAMIQLVLGEWLAEEGAITIGPATSLDEATALILRERIDSAMLDVNLGGRRVYPVADMLAARGIGFVFTTGYDDTDLPERFAGRPVLQKPFPIQLLVEQLGLMARAPALA